jgi:hypothetical protein
VAEFYPIDRRNRVRQLAAKASYERATVHAILDAGLVAHVGFVQEGGPVVVPMLYGRDGETLFLHGARKARVIRLLEESESVCVQVTLLDGIVLARSAFNSSLNYRSVTVFGRPELVEGREEKLRALRALSEHGMPGRWDELRAPLERELAMTGVVAVSIAAASAKVAAGPPEDEPGDYATPVWAGVVPLRSVAGEPQGDGRVLPGVEPSSAVRALVRRHP